MQRGMSYDTSGLNDQPNLNIKMPSASSREGSPRVMPRKLAKLRAESPGRMIAASNYRGVQEDAIDEVVAAECLLLPPHHAKALLIRKIAPGEYEVDGVPVRFSYNTDDEVMASTPGLEHEGTEPLSRYLPRAAEHALARAPLDLELPAFPWPFDVLSKSTPNVGSVGVGNIRGAVQRDALGVSNASNMVPEHPGMSPMAKPPVPRPVILKSSSMLETSSQLPLGSAKAGTSISANYSATIPVGGGNMRARSFQSGGIHQQPQSMYGPPGKAGYTAPPARPHRTSGVPIYDGRPPRPSGYVAQR
jgi:hypothetical protein